MFNFFLNISTGVTFAKTEITAIHYLYFILLLFINALFIEKLEAFILLNML